MPFEPLVPSARDRSRYEGGREPGTGDDAGTAQQPFARRLLEACHRLGDGFVLVDLGDRDVMHLI